MKKLFFLLSFPIFVFSQNTERQQKEQVRSTGTYNTMPSLPKTQIPSYSQQNNELSQKNSVREQNRNYYNSNNQRQVITYDPYLNYGGWGWNRWNPMFGWNSYHPYFWYDNWGYRNPGRIYVYDNGRRDTLKRETIHGSLGIQYNMDHEMGVWATVGRKTYFIVEFSKTNNRNISTYYPLLTLDKVLPWSDRKLSDEMSTNMFSVGLGKKFNKKIGAHVSLGVGKEERRFRFYDEMFVLSNNGEYSFPNYKKTITTLKIGTIVDISRNFTAKFDYDLGRGCISYGAGLKF